MSNCTFLLFLSLRSHVVVIDMLVEGRINPPPSTRQSVDLSSGSAPLAVPATAAVASAPHTHHHQHHFSSHCPEDDVQIVQTIVEENDVAQDEDVWRRPPLPRTQEKSTRSQSAAEPLPVIITTLNSRSCRRHSHRRTSQRLFTSQILICKILTPFLFLVSFFTSTSVAWLRQTSLTSSRPKHSKECSRRCHPFSSSHLSLITILSLISTTLLLLMMGSAVHCSPNSAPSSQQQNQLHSSTHSTSPSKAGLLEHAEKLFFGQMGLQRAPTPPPEAKVPQYMMDLYHWFRSNNHDRQLRLAEEDEDEGDDQQSHHRSKAVIALTGEDIAQLSNEVSVGDEEEEEEAKLIAAVNGHHRAPRRRRPSQASRVTLNGAASTVVGHKMNNHELGKY